jgi:DNA modification methylase
MTVRILVGDCREVLATLPAESVHCVVTSPPYWGLRDYGLPPTVWGGAEGCAHAWAEETLPTEVGLGNWAQGVNGRGEAQPGGVEAKREPIRATAIRGVCTRCGAWRGALGLEPDPALYVAHLVEVFRAVRRVLRADGTCWVNLGDSYSSIGWHPGGAIGVARGVPYVRGDYVVRRGSPSSNWRTAPYGGSGKCGDSATTRPTELGDDPYRLKVKDLIGIPWRVAFALQADGWWLRSEIIWAKPNPMPESVTDRPTKAHESLFLLAKSPRYFYDGEAIREEAEYGRSQEIGALIWRRSGVPTEPGRTPGSRTIPGDGGVRNKRSVWTIPSAPFSEAHFATFPPALVEPCVKAGTSARGACPACGAPWRREVTSQIVGTPRHENGRYANSDGSDGTCSYLSRTSIHGSRISETLGWAPTCGCAPQPVPCVVLDPFSGAGTVGLVADRLGRDAILIELKPEYAAMAERRIREEAPLLTAVEVEGEPVESLPGELGGKASTTPRNDGARWTCEGFSRPDGQPWASRARALPPASDNGHGGAAPEQLALDWSEIARVDVQPGQEGAFRLEARVDAHPPRCPP